MGIVQVSCLTCTTRFLNAAHYSPVDGRREKLLAHFNVPEFVANRTCFELNGYFGSKTSCSGERNEKYVTSCSEYSLFLAIRNLKADHCTATWFRLLVKMVHKVASGPHEDGPEYAPGKDYKWYEMTVFTRWDHPNKCQVLCVDTPFDFPEKLQELLHKQASPVDFKDPFGMHTSLVDQMIVYCDISVWRIRDPVRQLEKVRKALQIPISLYQCSHTYAPLWFSPGRVPARSLTRCTTCPAMRSTCQRSSEQLLIR